MAKAKNRLNTEAMFQSMTGIHNPIEEEQEPTQEPKEEVEQLQLTPDVRESIGRKKKENKKVQISLYIPPEYAQGLRNEVASRSKEYDQSSIIRTGIDIALGLTPENYHWLKAEAQKKGVSCGEILNRKIRR